jgi:hypothetical protein
MTKITCQACGAEVERCGTNQKWCSRCGPRERRENARAAGRRWKAAHAKQERERKQRWREAHRKEERERKREWTAAHLQQERKRKSQYEKIRKRKAHKGTAR